MTLKPSDIEDLQDLAEKTGEFTSLIFDWVAPLKSTYLLSHMYDFKTTIENKIQELTKIQADEKAAAIADLPKYWTFEQDGEIYDAEFETEAAAQASADEAFAEQCAEDSPRNGQEFEEDIKLICFSWDDDNGERIVHETKAGTVTYEHYHGDLAEHGTWHRGGGGVL